MDIHPIRSEDDYRAALREIFAYFDIEPEPGTPEGDRFDILLTLVEAYDAKHFPVDLPNPVEPSNSVWSRVDSPPRTWNP